MMKDPELKSKSLEKIGKLFHITKFSKFLPNVFFALRSQLILYNFDESDDAGVYRCFARWFISLKILKATTLTKILLRRFIPLCKSRCGLSYSNFESVFLETEVNPRSQGYFHYWLIVLTLVCQKFRVTLNWFYKIKLFLEFVN